MRTILPPSPLARSTPPLPITPPDSNPNPSSSDAAALQQRVHHLERQLAEQHAQLASLSVMEQELRSEAPDVDALVSAAIARHVAEQDARNAAVLTVLQTKVVVGI